MLVELLLVNYMAAQDHKYNRETKVRKKEKEHKESIAILKNNNINEALRQKPKP